MKRAGVFGLVVAAVFVAGCAAGDDAAPRVVVASETVPLGQLPDPPTQVASLPAPTTPPDTTAPPEAQIEPITGPVGEAALGNRLLLIGDTAMATLTQRQEATACPALPDLGWEVQIEAEIARYIGFADVVIDELVTDSGEQWDAVGLMFGHHVDTGVAEFGGDLDDVLARLGARPVLLYTIAEGEAGDDGTEGDDTTAADAMALAAALNEEIRARGRSLPNVVVVDWGQAVADDESVELVDEDRVPTADGAARLVELTAAALGEAPATTGGACLESVFTDDSAIVI